MSLRDKPAFANNGLVVVNQGVVTIHGDQPGMTLREYYAGLAMQALLQAGVMVGHTLQVRANHAIKAADALIVELEKE